MLRQGMAAVNGGEMLPIGAVAQRTGLSVPTIRYYEEIGLVAPTQRQGGGQRAFGPAALDRLAFIARCRDLGFSIESIRALLAVMVDNRPCAEARSVAQSRLAEVRAKLSELAALEGELSAFVAECSSNCADALAADCSLVVNLCGCVASPA